MKARGPRRARLVMTADGVLATQRARSARRGSDLMVKWVLVVGAVLVSLVVGVAAALPWLLKTPALQAYVAQAAGRALGRPVRFASLSVSVLPLPTVNLRRLEVAEDPAFGPGPFLTVGEGKLGIRLRPLLSGRVELGDLTLESPRIDLVVDGRGRWNWASLGAPAPIAGPTGRTPARAGSPAAAVLLSRVRIAGGTVRYRTLGETEPVFGLDKVDVTIRQTAAGGAVGLTGSAVAQPGNVELAIREASLIPVGGHAFADAAVKASVDVEARDPAALASMLGTSAAAGQIRGRLEIQGTLGHVVATGAVGFDRLTLSDQRPPCAPRPRQLALSDGRIPISYSGTVIDSAPLAVKVARGTVSLRVAATLGSAPMVTLRDIEARGVELEPILVDFLCQARALTGPIDLTGSATLRPDDPWRTVNGAGRLRVGPGKVTGREVSALVSQVLGLAGLASGALDPAGGVLTDFDSITASFTIANGVVRTDDLLYVVPDAKVTAAGTVTLPDGRVDMEVTLRQGANQVRGVVAGPPGALIVTPTAIQVPDSRGIRRFLEKLFR
jgi:AsmA protein